MMVVLTVARIPFGKLPEGRALFLKAFHALRRRPYWKKVVRAGVWGLGVTLHPDGWHLHSHTIVDSVWIKQNELREEWHVVCKRYGLDARSLPHLSRVYNVKTAVKELLSGSKKRDGSDGDVVKLKKELGIPFEKNKKIMPMPVENLILWGEILTTFTHKPWYHTFGDCRVIPEKRARMYCPRCGASVRWGREWESETVDYDTLHRRRWGVHWADYYSGFVQRPEDAQLLPEWVRKCYPVEDFYDDDDDIQVDEAIEACQGCLPGMENPCF